jgi:hypothetical protein
MPILDNGNSVACLLAVIGWMWHHMTTSNFQLTAQEVDWHTKYSPKC